MVVLGDVVIVDLELDIEIDNDNHKKPFSPGVGILGVVSNSVPLRLLRAASASSPTPCASLALAFQYAFPSRN